MNSGLSILIVCHFPQHAANKAFIDNIMPTKCNEKIFWRNKRNEND